MTRKESIKKPQRLGLDIDSPTWHHSEQVIAQLWDLKRLSYPGSLWGWMRGHAAPFLRRREMANSNSSCSIGVYINNYPLSLQEKGEDL